MNRSKRIRVRFLWSLTALSVLACGGSQPVERSAVFDLSARLPLASVVREPLEIRFGSPEAAPFLAAGWTRKPQRASRDAPFIWSKGAASAVRLPLLSARDLELTLRARPLRFPEAPPQVVTVEVNGEFVSELELAWGIRERSLRIPASALVEGDNLLVFRYAYTRFSVEGRGDRPSEDQAVAWYSLRVENAFRVADGEPQSDVESGRLFIPVGARLDFFLALPAESVLATEDWIWRGAGDARAEVTLETDSRGPRVLGVATPGRPLGEIALTESEDEIVRLAIRVSSPTETAGGTAGVTLVRPVVKSPVKQGDEPEETEALSERPQRPPNILIYMIDTLRADHLGAYGYTKPVSPRIDAFAARATLYQNAVAQSSWTKASVASILTGLWPVAHGANRRGDTLSNDALTLGEILQRAGYETAGIGANPNVSGPFGFRQGFDDFVLLRSRPEASRINQLAFDWLDRRTSERPFFLYLHTVEPHDPYDPPAEYRARFAPDVSEEFAEASKQTLKDLRTGDLLPDPEVIEDLLALYDAEIADNDAEFGLLIEALEERGLYDNTMIIVVSDHGEEFYDHGGWTHGRTLQAESINVPLIVRFPGQSEGRIVPDLVQHIDILPTVLDALGLPRLPGMEGESLRRIGAGPSDSEADRRRIFSYLDLDQVSPRAKSPIKHLTSVVEDQWKLVHDLGADSPTPEVSLFRWRSDGAELKDRSDELPVLAGYLRTLTAERLLAPEERLEARDAVIDKELEESLRALGYLP